MCGICGSTNEKEIPEMVARLKHRGPDMQGSTRKKGIFLGHTRLSIIDLSENAKQPMTYKGLTITFNGEIYNYKELREKYLKDRKLRTQSDTEVLLHLYEKYGPKCLSLLNGMWAFVVYNETTHELFLATDNFGKKPLYYRQEGIAFAFSSEAQGLVRKKEPIDTQGIQLYMDYGYIPAPHTAWTSIKKLGPATWMLVSLKTGKSIQSTYWSPTATKSPHSYEQAVQHLRALIDKSVEYRFVSDVPVGCFLSGGVDSSIVSLVAQKYKKAHQEDLHTFSISFDEEKYDESGYARQVAEHLGTIHHEEQATLKKMKSIFLQLPKIYGEPFADSSAIPTHIVSGVAKKHVTVSLSGDGGDELFGGYRTYNHYHRLRILNATPARYILPKHMRGTQQQSYNGLLGSQRNNSVFGTAFTGKEHWVNKLMQADLTHYMSQDILVKVDRASMAHALEVRNPLLDTSIADFSASLPPSYKLRSLAPLFHYENKRILKDAYRKELPKTVFSRKKMGFSIPQQKLLQTLPQETIDWNSLGINKKSSVATTYREHVLALWMKNTT